MDDGASSSSHVPMEIPHVHDPKECLKLRPKKGILKSTSSFDDDACAIPEKRRHSMTNKKAIFDEMNVIATHHPPDKDYGHMKVEEPKTPFHYYSDSEGEEQGDRMRRVSLTEKKKEIDPESLKEAILENKDVELKALKERSFSDDDSGKEESTDSIEHHKQFEMKRKQHYNEYQSIKLAKKLIEEDLKELEKEEEEEEQKEHQMIS